MWFVVLDSYSLKLLPSNNTFFVKSPVHFLFLRLFTSLRLCVFSEPRELKVTGGNLEREDGRVKSFVFHGTWMRLLVGFQLLSREHRETESIQV